MSDWPQPGVEGPEGPPGPSGIRGAEIILGHGAPSETDFNPGDVYLDVDTGNFYTFVS